ncbi:NADH-quinone oxidoreductase subunit NuoE [Actinomyces bowdenii]|uniref:NADH-quinone oxidoreductase subunit NuoE n=1 Tax=Actinomyces bowdenii TaxID=131109 RepID=A0A853EL44_9ACTO|nr:NADH-quinone oxidoreductase subunit NuoE [Actinomyces bowdenii]MBF0697874.1 NADH-quinone oxidoreductase subunit NuoE [Actinomyces bowdenii]NYS70047.1 NADH-quinone oxidoreductase subunit NuoE [Actinomyces bowdenii]
MSTTDSATNNAVATRDQAPATPGLSPARELGYSPEVAGRLEADIEQIIARYPAGQERSALIPMLHLIQSVDGYVSPAGIALCAQRLSLSRSEVSAVATFYSQFRRHPSGTYHVGVCTNALCAVMGGDEIWQAVAEHTGLGSDETSEDGTISLERVECNAACDYAPVVMVNWEFFDNQTPQSAVALVSALERGEAVSPTRGPEVLPTFKDNERLLAGFEDGHGDEGPGGAEPTLRGLRIAREKDWTAPKEEGK